MTNPLELFAAVVTLRARNITTTRVDGSWTLGSTCTYVVLQNALHFGCGFGGATQEYVLKKIIAKVSDNRPP
jgi:hypothetical protein